MTADNRTFTERHADAQAERDNRMGVPDWARRPHAARTGGTSRMSTPLPGSESPAEQAAERGWPGPDVAAARTPRAREDAEP
jgi:hypothetical protein